MLPHGLFAVSIITALLPDMSQHASNARWDELRERLSVGIRATFFLIFPAAVGYFVLGEPIVRILLQHGVMTERSTELVSGVLQFFVIGLLPFSLFQLFLRAFYALQDTKTPFLINCGAVALNTAINIPMFAWLGVRGLAAGHAIAYIFGVTVQGRALSKRIGGLDGARLVRNALRITVASIGMGALVWGLSKVIEQLVSVEGLAGQLVGVLVPVTGGFLGYLGLSQLLGIEELGYVRGLIARRANR
jgi:putative peptidoglycan lipid II flippase